MSHSVELKPLCVLIPRPKLRVTDTSPTFQFWNLNQPSRQLLKDFSTWSLDSFKNQLPYKCDEMKKHLTQAVFKYWFIYILIINMGRWKERTRCTWLLAAAKDLHGPCTHGVEHKEKKNFHFGLKRFRKDFIKILQQKFCHRQLKLLLLG